MNHFFDHPVDAVITWVAGEEESHRKKMSSYIKKNEKVNRNRFDQVEEIKFTVDSILKFFNSRSIETKLYRIPKLSEHFIYFNDDFFLIKETALKDFFIKGVPVLRGRWKTYKDALWYRRLLNKKVAETRANHRKGQEKGAKLLELKKFYKFGHTPHPMRKSTLVNFFESNPELEDMNSSYRFRHYNQFIPQGLANHLEIKNNTCVLKRNHQLVFIQNYEKSFLWLKVTLKLARNNKKKLFLNLQGLNQCPKEKLDFILNWLIKTTS